MALIFSLLDGRLHDRASFTCGQRELDHYLQQRAGQHQRDGIATTHVLIDDAQPDRILGYCALSAAQLHLQQLREEDRKRLPAHPVPAVRMGRLAIAQSEQGKGHGQLLLGHAVNLALSMRKSMGVRVLIVDAKNAQVQRFYEAYGFRACVSGDRAMYLGLGRPG